MAWIIEFDTRVEKELKKLDTTAKKRILRFLRERIAPADNPRAYGAQLTHNLSAYWKYRVGDYRVICHIRDQVTTVLVVRVGDRKNVYKKPLPLDDELTNP